MFNLEVPLVDKEDKIFKCGPNLIAPTSTINGIKKLDPSLISLANNHILDQGEEGLHSTIKLLKENGIPYIGVGENLKEANKGYILEKFGKKIGVYSCAEIEFTIATDNSCGANPFDSFESLDYIEKLRKECDYLIVLYHGGKEHYRYPSSYLQKVCRKISEKGADLIVCQHSHCIGCYEEYNNSTIVYGQGNFIFDDSESEYWQTSLIINLDIENNYKVSYIPIRKNKNVVSLAMGEDKKKILEEFNNRSKEILEENFIENNYKEFSMEMLDGYLYNFCGMNKWLRRIDKYIFKKYFFKKIYNAKKLIALQNFIECEAHRELLLKGIKERIERN